MNVPTGADRQWLLQAIDLSRRCQPTDTAFCVGAVVVSADGTKRADGYSRDTDPQVHAEESALAKLSGVDLSGATIYTSMEPCSTRASRPQSCTELIFAAGIRRVVYALREPPVFVDGRGDELLRSGGAEVIEITDLGAMVREINMGVLDPGSRG